MDNVFVLGLDRDLDAQARIECLVAEHQTKLARYVRRFVTDGDLALDVVQDVFFAAYRMLRADPSRPLTVGWLYKTATNRAITHLRKKKRRGETLRIEDAGADLRAVESSELSLDVQRALDALGEEQLSCVLLTTYAGYSSAEAALILGTTADAVRQRVCRAMRAMRKTL
ncbi:MAG: RNA polymerase sigma factor, partial [Candidatus Eremiobacteraeota bacterium]|nr:RNA polymerase sigma factor [Candidatus Eremiobacteraeota bacterium]